MRVADVMSTDVEFVAPEATVQDAAVLMGEIEVGAVPVGSAGRLEGVVTDRDILYRVVARGRDPSGITVREIMSRPVVTCRSEDSLRAAMDTMSSNHLRRLAVVDGGGAVQGWITLADLSRRLLVDSDALQRSLQSLTEAEPSGAAQRP